MKKLIFSFVCMVITVSTGCLAFELDSENLIGVGSVEFTPPELRPRPPIHFPPFIPLCRIKPDLVVADLPSPTWDQTRRVSVIQAVIRNQGGVDAGGSFVVRFQDGSYIYDVPVSGLAAGASTTVTFYPTYWVYNPDANYRVTVDFSNRITECNEANNFRDFAGIG